MRNTWDIEVPEHLPEQCYPCRGTLVFKVPVGCRGEECEDEKNCECDCHDSEPVAIGA